MIIGLGYAILLIEILIQIFTVGSAKRNDSKKWNVFFGTNIAGFITSIIFTIAYIIEESPLVGIGGGIGIVLILVSSVTPNIVLMVKGSRPKDSKIKLNKISLIIGVIITLVAGLVILGGAIIREIQYRDTNVIESRVLNHFNTQYGNQGFEVGRMEIVPTRTNTNWGKYGGNYQVQVWIPSLKEPFTVEVSKDSISESFVEDYYEEAIKEKYGLNCDVGLYDSRIPKNLGHIPTLQELNSNGAIHSISGQKDNERYELNLTTLEFEKK